MARRMHNMHLFITLALVAVSGRSDLSPALLRLCCLSIINKALKDISMDAGKIEHLIVSPRP
jgi:hypothetical protein